MSDHYKTDTLNIVTPGPIMALSVFVLGVTILNKRNTELLQAQLEKYHVE